MRKYFKPILIFTIFLLLTQSCSMDEARLNNKPSPTDNKISSDILMISEQEFISVNMTEPLSQEKYQEFYTMSFSQQAHNTAAPSGNLSDVEASAPFMDIEDIPVWRENKRTIKIYENGEVEIVNEFPLYEKFMQNTLIRALENVSDRNLSISKSVYSNGMMYLYNHKDVLLYSKSAQMPDFSSLIDSTATEQIQNTQLVKSMADPDISTIREIIQRSSGGELSIVRLEENLEGNIILQQVSQDGSTHIHTLLSKDLTKTYYRCILRNGQLQSRSYSYYTQDSRNFSSILNKTGSIRPMPCSTVTQTLVFKNGVPRIHSEYNYYTKNTTFINR